MRMSSINCLEFNLSKLFTIAELLLLVICVTAFSIGFNRTSAAHLLLSSANGKEILAECEALLESSQDMFIVSTVSGILFLLIWTFGLLRRAEN